MEYSIDYLLEEVNGTIQSPSAESLRVGVLRGVRAVVRKIGVKLVCGIATEQISIVNGRFRFPDRYMDMIDLKATKPNQFSRVIGKGGQVSNMGHSISNGMHTEHRLEFKKTSMELIFPNVSNGEAYLEFWHLYVDEQGDIIIPETIYQACFKFCEYDLLNKSNNTRNPKWQERLIMKADAESAIFEARGDLNSSNSASSRTTRFLR